MGTIRQILAINLRLIRGERNQKVMAALLDLEEKTYQRLERGENFPKEETLKQISEKLEIDELALVQDQEALPLVTRSTLIARVVLALPSLDNGELQDLATLAEGFAETSGRGKPHKLRNDPGQ